MTNSGSSSVTLHEVHKQLSVRCVKYFIPDLVDHVFRQLERNSLEWLSVESFEGVGTSLEEL